MGMLQRVVTGIKQKLWKTACLLQVAWVEERKGLTLSLYPARTASHIPMLEIPLPTALSELLQAGGKLEVQKKWVNLIQKRRKLLFSEEIDS